MTRNSRWIHARGNSANVFSSLVSIRPRDIHPPTRRAIHRDAVIKHGGAHEFRRATRKKEKKEKWKEEKEKKKKGEIKRIKDAQFNRAIAIFRKSYDFLFRLFRSSRSLSLSLPSATPLSPNSRPDKAFGFASARPRGICFRRKDF